MSNEKITITTSAIKLIYKTTNGRPIGQSFVVIRGVL